MGQAALLAAVFSSSRCQTVLVFHILWNMNFNGNKKGRGSQME